MVLATIPVRWGPWESHAVIHVTARALASSKSRPDSRMRISSRIEFEVVSQLDAEVFGPGTSSLCRSRPLQTPKLDSSIGYFA